MLLSDPDSSSDESLLMKVLKNLLKVFNSSLAQSRSDSNLNKSQRKLGALVFQILTDQSFPKRTLTKFWELLFADSLDLVIQDYLLTAIEHFPKVNCFVEEILKIFRHNQTPFNLK